ncbi:MAG: OmpA family protein [Gammaproteobacteria bacterium]
MNYLNTVRNITLAVSLVALAACSTTGKNMKQNVPAYNPAEATAQGLGDESTIEGLNTSVSPYRMKAPYDQIYFFAYDSNVIDRDDYGSIDVQGHYLNSHPGARILVTGNADERGSREYNIALGERRARAVADRLYMAGASKNQVRIVSYGAEKPIAQGHDEESHMKNRNAQLVYEQK